MKKGKDYYFRIGELISSISRKFGECNLYVLVVIVINLKRTQGGYTVYNTSTKKCTIKITPMPIWNVISLGIT